jgi:signal transduction histidine kinase/DNA-binding NarL/FixJ family response regulator
MTNTDKMVPDNEKTKSSTGSYFGDPLLHILIVEDNPGDVLIVKELIRSTGISVSLTQVSTLKETLAICIGNDFDVILLDLGLPDSVGLETLKKLMVFKIKSAVVVMTGLDDEAMALESLREGAQDYLVKNRLTSDNILRAIKYSIERKKIIDLQNKHIKQFSVLSSSTAKLNESEDISISLTIICENLRNLLDGAGVIAFEFLDPGTVRVSGIEWLKPWVEQIKLLTGWDLNKSVFGNIVQRKELLDSLNDSKLHEIKGGICEIFAGNVENKNCMKMGKMLDINLVYAISFYRAKIFYGGFLIFSHKLIEDDDIKIIETINTQTALSIHRKIIEKDLLISESRYKSLNTQLEQKVTERTRDLESANHQLQQELIFRTQAEDTLRKNEMQLVELNATKDKFFNIIAHDLKNPFTSLLGSSELLFQNIDKMDHENIKELALLQNESAKGGYAILQNLLDWSRSQTGSIKYNPVRINMSNLIIENISNLQFLASNKEINMFSEAAKDIYIFTDENMINTVLRNLLSNSIKFTHRGGNVIVNIKPGSDEVIISVKDNGTGIPQQNIDKLFRIDTKYSTPGTDKEQGTGLGLKLCREFIEKLGGRIWVKSAVNAGSEFMFSIPLKNIE